MVEYRCEMNGEEMMDGEMKVMNSPPPGSPTFLSTDIVFIVEAKECNRGFRTRRKIDNLAKHIEDQLQKHHFKQNRYTASKSAHQSERERSMHTSLISKIYNKYTSI